MMDLDYMKSLRWWFKTVDGWPSKLLGEKVPKFRIFNHKVLFVLWFILLSAQVEFLRRNKSTMTFFEQGHGYITSLMNVVTCQRVILIANKSYQQVTKMFVQKMHLTFYKNRSEYALQVYNKVNRYCRIISVMLQSVIVTAPLMFNSAAFYENATAGMFSSKENRPVNGTFIHSFYYIIPFDSTTTFVSYFIVASANFLNTCYVGVCLCIIDLYVSVLVFHVWGHIKILHHDLRNFNRPFDGKSWYSPEESYQVAQKLKLIINHHREIKYFADKCTTAFGPTLAFYFTFHQIVCCILLLECSVLTTKSLIEYGPMTVGVFQQLILISVVFELLDTTSDGLADSVYSLPWECMGVRERRVVLFFLCNVQKPIRMTAMGLVPVGVQTMASILKTSLSYFIMLKTLAD